MRQETINIYKFEELSEESKETAIEYFREVNKEDYSLSREYQETLQAFCDIFGVKWNSYDYLYQPYINYSFDLENDADELSGVRLYKYLINNYYDDIFPYSTRWNKNTSKVEKLNKSYMQRCKRATYDDLFLTGVCCDYDILKPIDDFLKKPTNISFADLINQCLYAWLNALKNDCLGTLEDDYIVDQISVNNYEFHEDGTLY